jgi:hypothetical protein
VIKALSTSNPLEYASKCIPIKIKPISLHGS